MLDLRAFRTEEPQAGIRQADAARLLSLACEQLRYGQAEEALVLLRVCQLLDPTNPRIILALAQVLTALEQWEAADVMLQAHAKLTNNAPKGSAGALLRSIVAKARLHMEDAKRAFDEFVAARRKETSA